MQHPIETTDHPGTWNPVAVFFSYIGLALVMTWPWARHLTTHTPDSGGEPSIYLWNLWYFREAVGSGSLFETDLLFVPFGANLGFHAFTIGRNIIAYPLLPLLGLVPTHNLMVLFSFGMAGLAVFLLVRDITRSNLAAFVSGAIYTFSPYRFAHIGSYNLSTMEWLPLFVYFTWRFLNDGKRRYFVAAVAVAFWTTLTSRYYGVYIFIWLGLILLLRILFDRTQQTLRRAATLFLVTAIAHIPFLLLLNQATAADSWMGLAQGEAGLQVLVTFSADLAAYFVPNVQHPFWQWMPFQPPPSFRGERVVNFGLIPTIAILLTTIRFRSSGVVAKIHVLIFWAFVLLSLGPILKILGQNTGIPLPFYLLQDVPFLREARVLSRYSLMALLCASIITGIVLNRLVLERHLRPLPVYLGVLALILFEFLPVPLQIADRTVPSAYHTIAADPVKGSVLDLPFGLNESFVGLGGWNPASLYYQTVTERPLLGGHISRIPRPVFDVYADMPIIGKLAQLERGGTYTSADIDDARAERAAVVQELDLRYIVVPAREAEAETHRYLLDVFEGCLEIVDEFGRNITYLINATCGN